MQIALECIEFPMTSQSCVPHWKLSLYKSKSPKALDCCLNEARLLMKPITCTQTSIYCRMYTFNSLLKFLMLLLKHACQDRLI